MRKPIVLVAVAGTLVALLAACTFKLKPGAIKLKPGAMAALTASGQLKVTVDAWSRFSTATSGIAVTSSGPDDIPGLMTRIFQEGVPQGTPVDLVFVVDTTGSMGDDIGAVRKEMRAILAELSARSPDRQIGVVAYRDLKDDYLAKTFLVLSPDDAQIQAAIDALKVAGGGDLREHVYAGLDQALREQSWRPGATHHIVLMGDAPPHDDYTTDPRNYDSVVALAAQPDLGVKIHTIGAKCDLLCQGLIAAGL